MRKAGLSKKPPRVQGMKMWQIPIWPDLLQRMKLVRAITGIPLREWARWQLLQATDLELIKRPGSSWLRPGSRIYKLVNDPTSGLSTIPLTMSQGGERVWIRDVLGGFRLSHDGDASLRDDQQEGAFLVDISATEDAHVEYREVVVSCWDVELSDKPWNTGISRKAVVDWRERMRREKERRDAAAHRKKLKTLKRGKKKPWEDVLRQDG